MYCFLMNHQYDSLKSLDSQCVPKIWYMEILSKYDWWIVFFLQWIVTKLEKQTCLRKDCFVRSEPYQLCVKATQLRLSSFWPQSKNFIREKKRRDCSCMDLNILKFFWNIVFFCGIDACECKILYVLSSVKQNFLFEYQN